MKKYTEEEVINILISLNAVEGWTLEEIKGWLKNNYLDRRAPPITGEDVAALLHGIHRHGTSFVPKRIWKGMTDEEVEEINEELSVVVYTEEDLLPVLEALGLPAPVWGKSMSIEEWEKQRSNS